MNVFDFGYFAAATVLSPIWARKGRQGWRERLGHAPALGEKGDANRPRVLLHAVSVGEVSALAGLVPKLLPRAEVVVATTTDTGTARAKKLFGEVCPIVRYPLDFSWSVKRFLDAVRPDVVGLVELEVWPNFVRACQARGVPVAVINGRLSAKSFAGYTKLKPVLGATFKRLAKVGAQDETYAKRFAAMGVSPQRLSVTGSMKWDSALSALNDLIAQGGEESLSMAHGRGGAALVKGASELAAELGIDPNRPLIVAGSTAEGEEKLISDACPTGVQLLCAPRKPERFDRAAADMPMCVRRSQKRGNAGAGASVKRASGTSRAHTDRFLLDTLGELRQAYALADLVVIGRSFVKLGASDPLEPAGLGKAVIVGPHFANFQTIVDELKTKQAISVVHPGQLRTKIEELLRNRSACATMAANARACIRMHAGASDRHAEMLLGLVQDQRIGG